MTVLIIKFGGTSVRYGINNIIKILNNEIDKWDNIIIVVSALSQITNMLLSTLDSANAKKSYLDIITDIRRIHHQYLIDNSKNSSDSLLSNINSYIKQFENICYAINIINEITPRIRDKCSSYGELMGLESISSVLTENEIKHYSISSDKFIKTDSNFSDANVNFEKTAHLINQSFTELFKSHKIILTTGFIGSNDTNTITTLGRGGSDYTATIIGSILNVNEIWIMTDVDGIMSSDPNKVTNSKLLKEIDISEISELAFYGAKVIHPKTIQPLENKNIMLRIKNTFNIDHSGTLVNKYKGINGKIRAITSINDISLLTVNGKNMRGRVGIASKIFDIVANLNISIPFITQASSETSICFCVSSNMSNSVIESINHLIQNNNYIQEITEMKNMSLITIVGINMKQTPGIAGKIFGLLGQNNINIIAISQGSSEITISIIIDSINEIKTLQILNNLI